MGFLGWPRLDQSNSLGLLEIIIRFSRETLLTAAIYTLLVLATICLGHVERWDPNASHKEVLEFLESLIFYSSSVIVLLVVIYLTVITAVEMSKSFRKSILDGVDTRGSLESFTATKVTEYSPIKRRGPIFNVLALYILPLALLLGVGCYQRRREQLAREALSRHVQEASQNSQKKENHFDFEKFCNTGGGVYFPDQKRCVFSDAASVYVDR